MAAPQAANVASVGFQVQDANGEWLMQTLPLDWSGWKQLEIDPTSHPAWTGGRGQMLDTGGQVARFNKRFGGLSLGKK